MSEPTSSTLRTDDVAPIRVRDGALELLDQTLLPAAETTQS